MFHSISNHSNKMEWNEMRGLTKQGMLVPNGGNNLPNNTVLRLPLSSTFINEVWKYSEFIYQ